MSNGLYLIMSPYAPCGNSASWWAVDAKGYTCDVDKAWRVTAEKARSILSDKRGDRAFLAADLDDLAERHFDVQKIRQVEELPLSRAKLAP